MGAAVELFTNLMMHIVLKTHDDSVEFDCHKGESLLFAGLAAGYGLPHECGTGTCGTCKAELMTGEVEHGWVDAPGRKHFGPDTQEILMCQERATSDCSLRIRGVLGSPAIHVPGHAVGTIVTVEPLNRDVLSVEISLDQQVEYQAGQFMLVQVPGVEGYRGWSMASWSAPARTLSFKVKMVPDGKVSGWLKAENRIGSPVKLFGPMGEAVFDPEEMTNLLCIAGGSGLAPMLAILSCASERGHFLHNRADLFFGVRSAADVFALDELGSLVEKHGANLRVVIALSEEKHEGLSMDHPELKFDYGMLDEVVIKHVAAGEGDVTAFLAGPPPMVDAAMRQLLLQVKLPPNRIRYDRFS